jgi:hypothetical protein
MEREDPDMSTNNIPVSLISIGDLDAEACTVLAHRFSTRAAMLRWPRPCVTLALDAGIVDENGPVHGLFGRPAGEHTPSYVGEAIVTMADGSRWHAVGHRATQGGQTRVPGNVEFTLLSSSLPEQIPLPGCDERPSRPGERDAPLVPSLASNG